MCTKSAALFTEALVEPLPVLMPNAVGADVAEMQDTPMLRKALRSVQSLHASGY